MRPMLASPGTVVPSGPGWAHEIKWDGMRVLADVAGGRVRLTSRNENDVTAAFPELSVLTGLARRAGGDLLLDGEVVAFEGGVPSFAALAARIHVSDMRRAGRLAVSRPVTFMIFDVLRRGGSDLTGRGWAARRAALEELGMNGPNVQVPPTYPDGAALQTATVEQGLEGVVSKKVTSRYSPGLRSRNWLKFPNRGSLSVVVGGWRPEAGSSRRLGSVLVGAPSGPGLVYLGRVGSGLAGQAGGRVLEVLSGLRVSGPSFADVPAADAAGVIWVDPQVVVEVRALGVSRTGRLRQPTFHGLRPDLSAADLLEVPGLG